MAATGYAANGTLPNATRGAQVRVSITAASGNPVKITANSHGFNTGDTVECEGLGGITISGPSGSVYQITKVDANNFILNGTTHTGSYSGGGYAVDYQLQPAIQIPAPGDAASMVTLGPVLEGNANPAPYLYRRTGKWRLYNQYEFFAGNSLSTPFTSNAWSSQTGLTTTGLPFTEFQNAQFTIESFSDTTSLPSYWGDNEFWVISTSFTVYAVPSANNIAFLAFAGACLNAGTGLNFGAGGFAGFSNTPNSVTGGSVLVPLTVTQSFTSSFDASNLYITLGYMIDVLVTGSLSLYLVGPMTGTLLQYRQN